MATNQTRHSTSSDLPTDLSFKPSSPPQISSSPLPKRKSTKSRNSLRILNINVQHVKRRQLLEALIISTDPDMIICTETWLNRQIATPEFLANELDYDVYRRDRTTDSHGGVLLAANKELTSSNIQNAEDIEFLSDTIKLKDQKQVVIGSYYRSPRRIDDNYPDKTKEEISTLLSKYKNSYHRPRWW